MPPKSNAERQKAYRERLKNEKPDKYEEIRLKHLIRVKENIKKKKEILTEEDKQELRAKWRQANSKRAEIKKKAKTTTQDNNTLEVRSKRKTDTKLIKEKLHKLTEENTQLKRRNKNLRQACNRMKRRIDILKIQLHEQTKRNKDAISIGTAKTSHCNDTPLTKSNSFIEETLPNVSDADKEKVKKKLLLLNTITDSLKTEFNKANPKEKKVFKKVALNEIANKHKLKTAISHALGLKGRIRMMKAKNAIKKKYQKNIQDFFEREDVSRPSAGKNECITRNKEKVQKRYLIKPIYKLYRQYKAEGGKASLQTFYRFRPFSVVRPRLQDRNTCACIKHCNLSFKALSLKKLGLLQTSDIDDLMKEIACNKSFKCMYSECFECKDKRLAIDMTIDADSPVQWLQWKMGTHTYTKISKDKSEEKQTKKYSKQVVKGTVSTLVKEFQDDVQKFKTHYFNVSHQYLAWKKCIKNLDKDEAALICDFSENFSCKQSAEIQAVHFGGSRNQVTLHTSVLYRKNENPQSICSISPSNEHGPGAIWAHLNPIMKLCKSFNIKKMHIFSDSPATQYRQKHNFFMFQEKLKDYGFEYATWNFFEASHGKGPADGVGGAVKRQLDNHIAHGNDITDAKEAYDYLKVNSKVKIFYINENDIQEMTKMIPDNVIPIKGTMKLHQISTDGKTKIKYKWLSCFDCEKNVCCNCYYTKEHELVKTYPTKLKTVPRANKRQALKKQNPPAKRRKRINSSTTTESDVDISFSDPDLIDKELENEDDDLHISNTNDEEGFENIELTDFRVKQEEIQNSSKKEEGKTRQQTEKDVTMLSSSRFMSANRAFYGTETKCLNAEGLTTIQDEPYSTLQDTEKGKCKGKGKGKGKKTVKPQQIIKDEKDPINRTEVLRQTDEVENLQSKTENLQSNEIKSHEEEELERHEQEELKTDINSMPVLFFEDLLGEELLITDDKDIFDALPFDNQEFNFNNIDNKERDVMVKNNNAIENKPEHDYINNENIMQIEDNHKTEGKTCGLTILKEEKLENIHTKNKVIYRKLKPLSLNSYINVPKQTETKSEKLTMKPKISRKDFNYYKDNEEIYKALMDSD